MTSTDSMSLADMAREVGINRQTVQKWHRAPLERARETTPVSALRAVAEAMEIEVPEADEARYPRSVFVAFCQAVGYMDEDGQLVPEVQERIAQKKRGRWYPAKPTLQPGTGSRRRRYYSNHVAEMLGLDTKTVRYYATPGVNVERSFPAADGLDEMDRQYWFIETVQRYRTRAERAARMQPADPDEQPKGSEAKGG
ncbi:helix-turn-helix transcriptional regulator [Streptomyces yaizuensis]|uniref:Helix-turn-helix domain-containing protein n=1 Tax=Streptomyces yaizuensis TaxID=2989713 RepID=A0ABQ5P7K9_9ACTN|nr:helix-turn-helix transcriptional regulator [Streptomyces sp. YSPA8]GLF98211.1 helix-turn-helix domain-containing protein [Streptomyces sp. YSPA8]